jgi:glycosyltransferase involved in cell wall biosynthesis
VTSVALVHDYLTQRGGAERVVLSMLKAFPTAPLYTSLYLPEGTFPEFRWADVRTLRLDRIPVLRNHHRLALPLLAPAFSQLRVEADVVVCSSSGWAHGVKAARRKVVYCHAPARWLYQPDRYIGNGHPLAKGILKALAPGLRRWDSRAAGTAQRYLTQSRWVRDRISSLYGIDAEILPAPYRLTPEQPRSAVSGTDPGFFLCISRLLPYKNVDVAIDAFATLPDNRLVVAGSGPEAARLKRMAAPNVKLIGPVTDGELAWLYSASAAVIAPSYEDYGLTAVEAAAFGKPVVALRFGGFLDTVREGETGVFFDFPNPVELARAVNRLQRQTFNADAIRAHARHYSEERFVTRLREIVLEADPD